MWQKFVLVGAGSESKEGGTSLVNSRHLRKVKGNYQEELNRDTKPGHLAVPPRKNSKRSSHGKKFGFFNYQRDPQAGIKRGGGGQDVEKRGGSEGKITSTKKKVGQKKVQVLGKRLTIEPQKYGQPALMRKKEIHSARELFHLEVSRAYEAAEVRPDTWRGDPETRRYGYASPSLIADSLSRCRKIGDGRAKTTRRGTPLYDLEAPELVEWLMS